MTGKDQPLDLIATPATDWQGDKEWGLAKSQWPADPAIGGFGVLGVEQNIGQFVPYGPPAVYELRFSLDLGDVLAPLVDEGLLKARLRYGVGSANHVVDLDLYSGASITIPGGPVSVSVFQEGQFSRLVRGVNASIAKGGAPRGRQPTCTFRIDGVPFIGPPIIRRATVNVPVRAVGMMLHCHRAYGLFRIRALSSAGATIAVWDSGTDAALFASGVPIPSNAYQMRVDYPSLSSAPFLVFILD